MSRFAPTQRWLTAQLILFCDPVYHLVTWVQDERQLACKKLSPNARD
jgi:hypothetical protein